MFRNRQLRAAPDLGGGAGPPTMFMCLAIYATCMCHIVIFSEKSLFVDAIIGQPNSSISLEE